MVGFEEKNFSYQQKYGNSENGKVGRLRREKCQKTGNPEKMRVRLLLFDRANRSHCNTMYFCYDNPKRKESAKCHCFFECF